MLCSPAVLVLAEPTLLCARLLVGGGVSQCASLVNAAADPQEAMEEATHRRATIPATRPAGACGGRTCTDEGSEGQRRRGEEEEEEEEEEGRSRARSEVRPSNGVEEK